MPGAVEDLPFDRLQARLLPVADLVMVLMLSRPASGTLRDTRVTLVTIYLAVATALLGLGLALLGLAEVIGAHQPAWLVGTLLLTVLAAGCGDLAVFGVRQRTLARRSPA